MTLTRWLLRVYVWAGGHFEGLKEITSRPDGEGGDEFPLLVGVSLCAGYDQLKGRAGGTEEEAFHDLPLRLHPVLGDTLQHPNWSEIRPMFAAKAAVERSGIVRRVGASWHLTRIYERFRNRVRHLQIKCMFSRCPESIPNDPGSSYY